MKKYDMIRHPICCKEVGITMDSGDDTCDAHEEEAVCAHTKEKGPGNVQKSRLSSEKSGPTTKYDQDYLNPSEMIQIPNACDVLLGRGKPFQNHDGNRVMLGIVDVNRRRYHKSDRAFKHEIIKEVLGMIKAKGGRFLERVNNCKESGSSFWKQVPERTAYRKVGHAFRSNARRISMENRGGRRNTLAVLHEKMIRRSSLTGMSGAYASILNEEMAHRGMSIPGVMGERLALAGAIWMAESISNPASELVKIPYHHRHGCVGLNPAQRELLAQEKILHSNLMLHFLSCNYGKMPSVSPLWVDWKGSLTFGTGRVDLRGRSQQF